MTALTGWRFWKIRKSPEDGSVLLKSVIRNDFWPPGLRFEAGSTSRAGTEKKPSFPETHSGNGIYAYKTSRSALENIDRFCYRGTLLGRVHLWGVIQKHRFGYRAQFAYPMSLAFGICCICKHIIHLYSAPFAIGWAYYHFSDDFSVNGILCEICNKKYYSLHAADGYRELDQLTGRYGIFVEQAF